MYARHVGRDMPAAGSSTGGAVDWRLARVVGGQPTNRRPTNSSNAAYNAARLGQRQLLPHTHRLRSRMLLLPRQPHCQARAGCLLQTPALARACRRRRLAAQRRPCREAAAQRRLRGMGGSTGQQRQPAVEAARGGEGSMLGQKTGGEPGVEGAHCRRYGTVLGGSEGVLPALLGAASRLPGLPTLPGGPSGGLGAGRANFAHRQRRSCATLRSLCSASPRTSVSSSCVQRPLRMAAGGRRRWPFLKMLLRLSDVPAFSRPGPVAVLAVCSVEAGVRELGAALGGEEPTCAAPAAARERRSVRSGSGQRRTYHCPTAESSVLAVLTPRPHPNQQNNTMQAARLLASRMHAAPATAQLRCLTGSVGAAKVGWPRGSQEQQGFGAPRGRLPAAPPALPAAPAAVQGQGCCRSLHNSAERARHHS